MLHAVHAMCTQNAWLTSYEDLSCSGAAPDTAHRPMTGAPMLQPVHTHPRMCSGPQVGAAHGQELAPHQAPHLPLRRLERISQVPSAHAFYCPVRLLTGMQASE